MPVAVPDAPSHASNRRRLVLVVAFLVSLLAVLIATTYTFYSRARSHFDSELGERLRAVATTLARATEIAMPDSLGSGAIDASLYAALFMTREENGLSNIVLLDPDGRTLLDLDGVARVGEPNPFIDLDIGAMTAARSGLASSTILYRSGDIYMKSAYAPVFGADGRVSGLVGVEAGAGFFDELQALSRLIIAVTGLSALVVVFLGVLFYRQSRSLDHASEAMVRREHLATMGRMVANIAHEVRNPLSVIRTSAERLRRRQEFEAETMSYIIEEVDELNRIVTGYLEFANGRSEAMAPLHVRRVVTRCVAAAADEAAQRGVEIVDCATDEDVQLRGDERRLRQALLNVVLNAVQASKSGGAVRIENVARGERVGFRVVDDGHGMTAATVKGSTRPFFTTRSDGSGLGLHIVQTIVEEHDGNLEIESTPGEGTRVTMWFDRAGKGTD